MKRNKPRSRSWTRLVLRVVLHALAASALIFATILANLHFATTYSFAIVEQGRKALDLARRSEVERYSPALYKSAASHWDECTKAMVRERNKPFYNRDFWAVEDLAMSTRRIAHGAALQAVTVRREIKSQAGEDLLYVQAHIARFQERYGDVPLEKTHRTNLSMAQIRFGEGKQAFERKDYPKAAEKLTLARSFMNTADSRAESYLRSCFVNASRWREWARETIDWSARANAVAIVVDKMAHLCKVYRDGRLIAEYPVELGPRWMGPKTMRGDGATPEGKYHITRKKGNGQTKYYKALEINYPNDQDRIRFASAKKRGEISRRTGIGSLIEIHGDGGRGGNWTAGCVALTNRDIDKIFHLVGVGTPVTIVGSCDGSVSLSSLASGQGSARGRLN